MSLWPRSGEHSRACASSTGSGGSEPYPWRSTGSYGSRIDTRNLVNAYGKLGKFELWDSSRNGGENGVLTRSSAGPDARS